MVQKQQICVEALYAPTIQFNPLRPQSLTFPQKPRKFQVE